MKQYLVRWEIEIDATNPLEAAKQALEIQRDETSIATFFEVVDPETNTSRYYDLEAEL